MEYNNNIVSMINSNKIDVIQSRVENNYKKLYKEPSSKTIKSEHLNINYVLNNRTYIRVRYWNGLFFTLYNGSIKFNIRTITYSRWEMLHLTLLLEKLYL